ncbi:hypothetical protein E0H59_07430 [Rhizobium leguminosarum bv. viciae]|nr:hypothetical protein E0H59_07430 [Rhizobium leguminosarum bv. viciae]
MQTLRPSPLSSTSGQGSLSPRGNIRVYSKIVIDDWLPGVTGCEGMPLKRSGCSTTSNRSAQSCIGLVSILGDSKACVRMVDGSSLMLRETIRCRGKTCGPLPVWPQLPLYRQAQIMSRQGIDLDRSTLADWVGRAAFELRPVFDALITDLKRSTKLFMDETRAPFSIPARARPRPDTFGRWRGMIVLGTEALPQVSPSPMLRVGGGLHAERILQGFSGILQVDGYAGYNRLIT